MRKLFIWLDGPLQNPKKLNCTVHQTSELEVQKVGKLKSIFLCSKGWVYPAIFDSQLRSENQTTARAEKDTRKERRKRDRKRGERMRQWGIKPKKKSHRFFQCDPCAVTFQQSNQNILQYVIERLPAFNRGINIASKTHRNGITNNTSFYVHFVKCLACRPKEIIYCYKGVYAPKSL